MTNCQQDDEDSPINQENCSVSYSRSILLFLLSAVNLPSFILKQINSLYRY
jgi:hypothetical protein